LNASGGTTAAGGTLAGLGGTTASGGTGGALQSAGEECRTCSNDACLSEVTRCEESPVCADWLDCVTACADDSCARECDETYKDAVLLTTPVYQCMCGQCDAECSALNVCEQTCEEGPAPPAPTSTAPSTLAETGLYTLKDDGSWEIADYVREYRPEYELFSDYSVKQRYIYLPRCSPIDTTDMNHWSFPVGTRLWKQFTRDGVRIETRLLARYGTGVGDWLMTSYQWPLPAADGAPLSPTDAVRASDDGVSNVNGTTADIPSHGNCQFCHERLSERVLGFGAIQLSHNLGGLTFSDLADWGVLSNAPVRTGYDPPGDAVAQAALGYLHGNCGGCHNDTGVHVSLFMRLLVEQTTVESTWTYTTGVNVFTGNPAFPMDRITPGDPAHSAIIARMQRNPSIGESQQMPPVDREVPHTEGIATVSAWIQSLPH
jgi:hypothetical protein